MKARGVHLQYRFDTSTRIWAVAPYTSIVSLTPDGTGVFQLP